ncbi:P-loop containing nucleoside triphosphate hydrolase protein [Pluteus cervinus]|uniref:P-loop containing nucleoside triphosphate hydrolase protein n=1 Tax=Pluteus cervinus TaxID=181527 RepID=A0ACD3A5P5_9AGAR|nr:P-loop containing nucleoside triphosphate hydrolase protein [Pluteus cervinus]
MFAIASDDVDQVKQVLESGDAGPNDTVGPQSALEFVLTNDRLTNKMEIVKTLLAYGADPAPIVKKMGRAPTSANASTSAGLSAPSQSPALVSSQVLDALDALDPATRYYVARADAAHTRRTSALIHRSFFRPLTRVRYELVGQDRAIEQLFRVLSIHSRQLSATPLVVLLCGPSGHGKSLLARKFGALLDVPTHTVNMTTLRSTHDLWKSYSMSPYETPTSCTLAEFLINNEGKRCVVVLDEIEKTEDEKTLWSLLMPWELGRCSFEASSRHIDVRNVVWLGTSNIGHDLVFQHHESRDYSDEMMSREEYVALMEALRPRVSERLGASIMSRVTTVLPFVPFTLEEKRAICSEALNTLAGDMLRELSPSTVESAIQEALASYVVTEGARSLYRAISNKLVDIV